MTTKAIFITGGGSGIGRAVAQRFAREGWRIGLADVNAKGLSETAALLPAGMSDSYVMDVRDRDAWKANLDDFTAKSGGRLDVLFNNAGIGTGGPIAEMSFEDLDRVVQVNLVGVLNGAKIGHADLAKTRGSWVLDTASAAGF
jgi:NAD(P)-dependent dehydrogenase (short-subunit alcohol dehydrogenase family)